MILEQKNGSIILNIPETLPDSGEIIFYRPNQEKAKDIVYTLKNHEKINLNFDASKFKKGIYVVKISWWQNEKGYYIEKRIFIN
jgi:hypothetical protein